jgi:hypothetical protein
LRLMEPAVSMYQIPVYSQVTIPDKDVNDHAAILIMKNQEELWVE